MSTPSHRLAQRIIQRLLADGLLLPADEESTQAKLAAGTLRGEDWRFAIENGIEQPSNVGSAASAGAKA